MGIHACRLPGEDEGGGVHLLDDGGALDAVAVIEVLAAVDRRFGERTARGQPDLPRADLKRVDRAFLRGGLGAGGAIGCVGAVGVVGVIGGVGCGRFWSV